VTVFYRFQGEDVWKHLSTDNGQLVLSAEGLSNSVLSGSGGTIELFAWDGSDKSGDPLKLRYAILEAAQPGAERIEQAEESESESDHAMSQALIVALSVAGVAVVAVVAVVALIAAIVISATRVID
jgi:hypothetical protein